MKGMLIMKYTAIFTAASVAALIAGSSAFAQDGLTGVQSLNDRIDDITTAASDELNEQNDPNRFGLTAANAGWKGSLAASASATSGNTKNRDVSIAGRMTYGSGVWSHSFGFAGEFGSTDGVETKEKLFGTYEANRYFTANVYGFATGRATKDKFGHRIITCMVQNQRRCVDQQRHRRVDIKWLNSCDQRLGREL